MRSSKRSIRRGHAALALALLCAAPQARGADKFFSPLLGSTDWQNDFNWSPTGVPAAGDNVTVAVTNGSVTLSANTSAINTLSLTNGSDLGAGNFTLTATGTATLGGSGGVSQLSLGSLGKASLGTLVINSSGLLSLGGGEAEIDNVLTVASGGGITGRGTVDLRGLGAPVTTLVNNGLITASGGTLHLIRSGTDRLDLDGSGTSGMLLVNTSSTLRVTGLLSDAFGGELRFNGSGATARFDDAWTANGHVRMISTNATVAGAAMSMSGGTLTVGNNITNGTFTALIDVPLSMSNAVMDIDDGGINSSTTLRITGPATFNNSTLGGSGRSILLFEEDVNIFGNVTIDHFTTAFDPTGAFPQYVINPGATLNLLSNDLTVIGSPPLLFDITSGTLSGDITASQIAIRDGGTINGEFTTTNCGITGDGTAHFNGLTTINGAFGNSSTQQAQFHANTTINGTGSGDFRFHQRGTIAGTLSNGAYLFDGTATFNGATLNNATVTLNGPSSGSLTTINDSLLRVGGSSGANASLLVSNFAVGDLHVAAAISTVASVLLSGTSQFTASGSVYVGGNQSGAEGLGSLRLAATNPTLSVNDTIRVWPSGDLIVEAGTVTTENLLMDGGGRLTFTGGSISVDGGFMTFGTSSFGYGGATFATRPNLRILDGADASVQFALRIGDGTGNFARAEVSGTNAGGGPSMLRNTGGGAGADLIVGDGGSGQLIISDGGLVDFHDDVVVGQLAGSSGSVIVAGVSNGQRATLRADGSGADSQIVLGGGGDGTMDVADGALVHVSGDINIANSGNVFGAMTAAGSAGGFNAQITTGDDIIAGSATAVAPEGGGAIIAVSTNGVVNVGDELLVRHGANVGVIGGTLTAARINLAGGSLNFPSGTIELTAGESDLGGFFTVGDGVAPAASFIVSGGQTVVTIQDELDVTAGSRATFNDAFIFADAVENAGSIQMNGARLDLGGFSGGSGSLLLNGGVVALSASNSNTQRVVLQSGGGSISVATARTVTFGNTISGAGALHKTGAGSLVLTGNNTYGGDTFIRAGTLRDGGGNAIGDNSDVTILAGATLDLNGFSETIATLSGAGAVNLGTGGALTTGAGGGSTLFSGAIAGAGGSLVKQGSGTFVLSGASTYSGATTVAAGVLDVRNTTGSATGSGEVIVQSGATLAGNGNIDGHVNLLANAALRPGGTGAADALGVGEAEFEAGSTFHVDIAGTTPGSQHDQLIVQALAALDGTLSFTRVGGFQWLPNNPLVVMSYGGRFGAFDQVVGDSGFAGLTIEPVYGAAALTLEPTALGGDANLDGIVNLQDFNALASNFGQSGRNWLTGDFTGDGIVNLLDFNVLAGNFGQGAGPDGAVDPGDWSALASAVPEPGWIAPASAALWCVRRRRWRRRSGA